MSGSSPAPTPLDLALAAATEAQFSGTRFLLFSGRGAAQELPLADLPATLPGEGYVWLDFFNPTPRDLEILIERFGVHPLSIEDCFDQDQIPKVDDLPTYTFILFNSFRYAEHTLTIEEVDFFVGKNFLATVHRNGEGRRLFTRKLLDAVELDKANVKRGPDFLLHVVLDFIVDQKLLAIEALQEELDEAEESILCDPSRFHPEGLLRLRRNLLHVRKSLFHEREVFVRICRRDSPFISEKAIYHFRDIYDHLARFFETTEICREMISTHMEMYLSLANHRMSLLANQTNSAMRRLTLITTIFMPLTLIAGIGGMSEWSMMTGAENWRVAYPAFLALMAVLGATTYSLLRWVDRRRSRIEAKPSPSAEARSGEPEPPLWPLPSQE